MDTFAALKAFVAVIEGGGFAPAGRRMGVATSSVTRQVDALEKSLGTQLLNRSTRSVTLTSMGESYFEQAVRILGDLENANLEVSEAAGPPRGLLRVSLPVTFARLHIAPAIAAFSRLYPGIRLDLSLSDDRADLVGERLDLAIRLGSAETPSVVARKIAPHRRLLCASPDYLEQWGEPQAPAELAERNCLTFSYTRGHSTWCFSGRSEQVVRVSGNLRTNNSEVLREAAVGGMGLVLLPSWLVGADIEAGRLRVVLPDWEAGLGGNGGFIYAVYLPGRRTSKKVRAFVDFLVERFGSPPYWDVLSDATEPSMSADGGESPADFSEEARAPSGLARD
ncbi:LysR family transcriptional regulator [Pseudomonas gingeri]|uniref:LysR family transcriptional regulator n=1 Tax=Pseudomonas gingeri TaxID=117681 RepID=A0A7Y7YHC9_9PSED|nr:LysR family transcriptional regulator [Pseudomonas gingeri]NWA04660.1 LysR family transcriptional regulator [Pseudomonas gingeri]NWA13996.1 LysR family transcriptional regulator [Pseudomonas gingeri]NWA59148.1 LysR family transcriptional regulator [Pseudomonas gingeri]NWA99457.1 LysR family transcriptional regulator [Pseudomonas gingeri]NWB05831.1 LysR family transcriptional regulator [Pseudomonas gingeri]